MPDDAVPLVLSRFPARFQPRAPVDSLGNAGGHSGARLWRYRAADGVLVLRAWPLEGPSAVHLKTIHDWLRAAADLGFIPVPITGLDGESVLARAGRCWELAPWKPGAPDLGSPPSRDHVLLALEALAALHVRLSARCDPAVSPGLRLRARELQSLEGGGLDVLENALARSTEGKEREMGDRWLALARTAIPQILPDLHDRKLLRIPLQPCLRDARPEHLLFEGNALTGLVDFGAMGIETVAADLARLIGEWFPGDPQLRDEAMEAYGRIRPLGESEAALLTAFETAADVLVASHWLRWRFLEHRTFEDPLALTRGIARGLERIERLTTRLRPGRRPC
jgi:homoserine kinase type II